MDKSPRKKKIFYVITKSNWGGAQKYVFALASHFSKKYDVSVVLGGEGTLKKKLEDEKIPVESVPYLGRDVSMREFAVFRRLVAIFKKEKPDIVHLNSSKIGAIGALAARIAKVPKIIFTAHGWAFREERHPVSLFAIRQISALTVFLSHTVITVSRRDEKEGKNLPGGLKKTVCIHNGVAQHGGEEKLAAREKLFRLTALPDRDRLHYIHDAVWLGTIGELHKNKGHEYALLALSKLPKEANVFFCCIGEGEERAALEAKVKKLGLENKVSFIGKRSDASELLSAFDIFLFPSIKEGLPYAILEAGLAELPVIASAVGGIPEIIDDMKSGILVRPKHSEELAKALDFALSHEKEMRAFGKALRARVKKDFSLSKMFEETEKTYSSKNP